MKKSMIALWISVGMAMNATAAPVITNWEATDILVEHMHEGQWKLMQPLSMNEQVTFDRTQVDGTTFQILVNFRPSGTQIIPGRKIVASCNGVEKIQVLMEKKDLKNPWEQYFECGGKQWRLKTKLHNTAQK